MHTNKKYLSMDDIKVDSINIQLPLKAEQVRHVLLKKQYTSSAASHHGIWIPLLTQEYDEAIPHAACSARNLIDCAGREVKGLGLESDTKFDPYSKVDGLEAAWKVLTLPELLEDNTYSIPVKFIKKVRQFFDDFAARQTRRARIEETVPRTDTNGKLFPENDRNLLIKELQELDLNFSKLLHQQDRMSRDEFIHKVTRLEEILMDFILPKNNIDNLDLLDQLIKKFEQP